MRMWFSGLVLGLAALVAQGPAAAAVDASYVGPVTAFGQPDLEGDWTNATLTPFTRNKALGGRGAFTPDEAARLEGGAKAQAKEALKPTDPKATIKDLPYDCGKGFKGVDCGYNAFWTDSGDRLIRIGGAARTSIITDPSDGQLPEMTPEGKIRAFKRMSAFRSGPHAYDNPESRSLGERCITSFGSSAGPPMLPLLYNNNYQIVQTPDTVAIVVEMVHDVRVIRLTGGHAPGTVRTWMGDSIGHFEGRTLVVETTNIRQEQAMYGFGSDQMSVVERFTRISPREILYQFTVTDPKTYTRPFSGEEIFSATKGPLYEYACHEGNYALPHILAGARAKEKLGLPYDVDPKGATSEIGAQGEGGGE